MGTTSDDFSVAGGVLAVCGADTQRTVCKIVGTAKEKRYFL
ncbi:MAG: hypothetical protein ACI4RV_02315 [Eubacteriales bacterium]